MWAFPLLPQLAVKEGPRPPARKRLAARQDRPGSTPWEERGRTKVSLSDKRIETWRAAGFTTVMSAPKGGFFFSGSSGSCSIWGEKRAGGPCCEIAGGDSRVICRSREVFGSGFPDSPDGAFSLMFIRFGWTRIGA